MNETIMLMENNDTATIITAIPMNDSTDSNTIADEEENVFFFLVVGYVYSHSSDADIRHSYQAKVMLAVEV